MNNFSTFNVALLVVGAILITAGIKGVAPRQVVKDSVSNVAGGKPITIVGVTDSVKTPVTGGAPNVATGK